MKFGNLLAAITAALSFILRNCEGKFQAFQNTGESRSSARLPSVIPLGGTLQSEGHSGQMDLPVQAIPIVKHVPEGLMGLEPHPDNQNNRNNVDEGLLLSVIDSDQRQCQPIEESVCQRLPYANTILPNSVGLTTQLEAGKRMQDYHSLINVGCSQYLRFFLCTVYFPMCSSTPSPPTSLLPCRPLCQHVQRQCEPIMKRFSFPWPRELSCDRLPAESDMCIQPHDYSLDKGGQLNSGKEDWLPKTNRFDAEVVNGTERIPQGTSFIKTQEVLFGPSCNMPLWLEDHGVIRKRICAVHCQADLFYQTEEKEFATLWMTIWSMVTALNSLITLVTFLSNPERFAYPHRSVVYLSVCYLGYAGGYLLRILLGRQRASCHVYRAIESGLRESVTGADESYLIGRGHETAWCVIIFILTFYFQQASCLWWLITGITWYLSAARHWANEGLMGLGTAFHLAAWTLPAILTILAILLHQIEADELSGVCLVSGFHDLWSNVWLELVPQTICLVLGSIFQIVGFTAISSMRRSFTSSSPRFHCRLTTPEAIRLRLINGRPDRSTARQEQRNAVIWDFRRLDKLFIKMAILCLLYILPSICVHGVDLFKLLSKPTWLKSLSQLAGHQNCLSPERGVHWQSCPLLLDQMSRQSVGGPSFDLDPQLPSVEADMMQMFMSMITGTTTSIWLWCNRKTWVCCVSKTKGYCRKTSNLSRRVQEVNKMREGNNFDDRIERT